MTPARSGKQADNDLCYRMDKWPRRIFADETREGGFLADATKARKEGQWPAFVRELFGRLYDVGCKPLDAPTHGAEWAAELHQQADALPEWRDLFGRTRGDDWRASLVAAKAASILAPSLPALPDESAETLNSERNMLEDVLSDMRDQRILDIDQRIHQALGTSAAATDALRANNGFATRSLLRKAATAAAAALQEVDDAMQGLGGGHVGAGSATSALAKRAMLSAVCNNDRLRRIAALAGRFRVQAAQKQRTKTTQERQEIVAITKGNDLQRLLASEVGLLSSPVTRPFVLERIAEKRALQYELGGKATMARGPIVFLIDKSSSMRRNARDEWACAVALGIMEVARIQRRPFAVAFFNGAVVDTFYFNIDDMSQERTLQMLAVTPTGGTVIANALAWAYDVVKGTDGKAQWPHGNKSDVVLISDGDDDSDIATPAALLKAEGASIYAITIDSEPRQALRETSTEVVRVSHADMAGANAKLDGVFSI